MSDKNAFSDEFSGLDALGGIAGAKEETLLMQSDKAGEHTMAMVLPPETVPVLSAPAVGTPIHQNRTGNTWAEIVLA